MRRLVLMRHAKTETAYADVEDHPRALVERGRTDAARVPALLSARGASPDRVLVSDATRTQQTWQILAQAFPNAEVSFHEALYLASGPTILQTAEAHGSDGEALLVLGHNPGLKDAADLLMRGGQTHHAEARAALRLGLPTAWACLFVLADGPIGPGSGQLVDYFGPPRVG